MFYGNPNSTHSYGRSARTLIEKARKEPEKVKQVLEKIKSEGLFSTIEKVFNKDQFIIEFGLYKFKVMIKHDKLWCGY